MGSSLTGQKINQTYDALLKVSDNGALDGTLQTITDGLGNDSALSLSTAGASVGGTLAVSGAATLSSTLGVSGAATLSSTLAVSGNLTVDTNTLFVDAAANNVGIGKSPAAKLDVNGNGIFNNNVNNVLKVIQSATSLTSGEYTFLVDSSSHGSNQSAAGAMAVDTYYGRAFTIKGSGDIAFNDSSANEAFYWDASAASLGIGTTTPSSKFHILAETPILRIQGLGAGEFGLKITDANASLAGITYNSTTGEQRIHGAESYVFQTIYAGGSERMRIDSSGNVGIGVDNPQGQLHMNGTLTFTEPSFNTVRLHTISHIHSSGVDSNNALLFNVSNGAGTTAERMRINGAGGVTIGDASTSNTGKVEMSAGVGAYSGGMSIYHSTTNIDGSGYINFFRNTDVIGSINQVGTTSVSYNTSSDYRLKEDWVAMEGALERVDALKPINFAWKADGRRVDGFLAHELAEVVPEAVTGEKDATEIRSVEVSPAVLDEEGNVITEAVYEEQEVPVYQGIDQSKIVPLLVAAIQELRDELNALKQA